MMDDHRDILQTLKDNKSDVTSCDFGGNYLLAVGSSDKTVRVLEWKIGLGFTDLSYSPLRCHKYGVTWVRFSPQGTMLASASVDGTTILWNVKTGLKIHTMVQATKCSIRRCEFTPDSTKLITAGDDGVFCFWDLIHRTHICKHYLHNEEDACVQGLAISPDSECLLTGDSSGMVKLWCLTSVSMHQLQLLQTLKNMHDGVTSCQFSSSYEITGVDTFISKYMFATCGADGLINVWALEVKRKHKAMTEARSCDIYLVRVLQGHNNDVLNIQFNVDGSLIASTGLDKSVRLWQVNTGECLKEYTGHTRYVNCCAFSRGSEFLASGSNDRTVIVWDLNHNFNLDSELVKRCSTCRHFAGDTSVRFLAEELFIRQSESSLNQLEQLQILNMSSGVNSIHFYESTLAVAGGDKSVTLWKKHPDEAASFVVDSIFDDGPRYSINQVEISPCGTKLISCFMNGTITITDLQIGVTFEMKCPDCVNSVRTSRFSPNSECLASGGDDQKVFLWDVKNLEFIKSLQEHKDAITSVAFSPDNKLIASTCSAGDLKVYSLEEEVCYAVKDCIHDLGATCCDFSCQTMPLDNVDNEAYILATCGNDSLIKIWHVKLHAIFEGMELSTHGGNVVYVRFSPARANLLASCATDCTARLWNVGTGECLHVFDQHQSIVTTCAFSKDSTLFATGSLDKKVIIWRLPRDDVYREIPFAQGTKKLLQHWTTSDVIDWLNEFGLTETCQKVKRTTLNGQQLLGMKISDLLDLIGANGEERKIVALHLYWLKSEAKRNNSSSRLQSDAPHQYLCPITHEIMSDPVICSDGFTYERGAITEWLLCGKYTSPMTNEPLNDVKFLPNVTLKTSILRYLYGDSVTDS